MHYIVLLLHLPKEAQKKYNKVMRILKQAEKARGDQESTFGIKKDPLEGGPLGAPVGGEISDSHVTEDLVRKQLMAAQRRLEVDEIRLILAVGNFQFSITRFLASQYLPLHGEKAVIFGLLKWILIIYSLMFRAKTTGRITKWMCKVMFLKSINKAISGS